MTVAIHKSTGTGTAGANMFGRCHADKEITVAQGILHMPGGGGTETTWQIGTSTNPNEANLVLHEVTKDSYGLRFLSFATDWTWGNDTIITRIDDAFTEAQTFHNFSGSLVHLYAVSLGATCALNWAKANPSKVASISLVIPAVDIQDIEDNNRLTPYGLPQPSTAYGGSRPPDDHNPADNTSAYVDMPIKIWYSTNDTVCIPATVLAFGAAVGATMVNLGDQTGFIGIPGHNALTLEPTQVASFITEFDVAEHVRSSPKYFVTTAGRGQ